MKLAVMTLSVVASITLVGCGSSTESPSGSLHAEQEDEHPLGDEHGHPEEGPHHGGLIELGNEEYHAEVVHNEASGTVTIYLLDSSAKVDVPIYATEIHVNLSHDGQAEQFVLAADPQLSDPPGKSSRFVSVDAELAEDLDHEGAEAQLVTTIGGKQYRGEIHHDHDDEGHEDGADGHDHGH